MYRLKPAPRQRESARIAPRPSRQLLGRGLELRRDVLQKLSNGQVLGTGALALAAADAVARPAAALGVDAVVVEGLALVAVGPLGVEAGKQRRDVDAPGAAGLRNGPADSRECRGAQPDYRNLFRVADAGFSRSDSLLFRSQRCDDRLCPGVYVRHSVG